MPEETPRSTSWQPSPSTTCTSTTPEFATSTGVLREHSSTITREDLSASPSPDGSNQSLTLTDSSLSFIPSQTRADSSTETSNPSVTRPGRSLNVPALAIGVTGAVLFLTVCTVVAFYLWKRKQRKKVAPSAEFRDLASAWNPRTRRETASSRSSIFALKDGTTFAPSPDDQTKHSRISVPPYSPRRNTPPWLP